MLDISQVRQFVVRPSLKLLEPYIMWTPEAEELLMGTAAQESNFVYLHQISGPARGIYQIEPATADDIYENFLHFRPDLERRVMSIAGKGAHLHDELTTNLAYSTIIARLVYYRAKGALPAATDIPGMAEYWKANFNTELGKGTTEEFVTNYETRILKH